MNTISARINGQNMTRDGQSYIHNLSVAGSAGKGQPDVRLLATGAEVAGTIAQNMSELKQSAQRLQKLSDMIMVNKLQFNVNQELGNVVIKIVDPNTDTVIREIPSEDMQRLQIRLRKTIGILFDKTI
ncbi:MAG: flagellar protein FlaG [Treponema sp.]|nr:flagellar protein FlaG [Treponema sp.]